MTEKKASLAVRLDKWLWAVRIFKTRPLATEACRKGGVEINGLIAKPAREVHAGEMVMVRERGITRTLRVLGAPPSRLGAKLVSEYCTDLTPPAEWEKLRAAALARVAPREKGSGRPTKRDRRILDRLLGE
jgi:ribosome-associated heat shock protein Hsp15